MIQLKLENITGKKEEGKNKVQYTSKEKKLEGKEEKKTNKDISGGIQKEKHSRKGSLAG